MTFAAIDDRGKRLGSSKNLAELQARFAERTRDERREGDRGIRSRIGRSSAPASRAGTSATSPR